MQEGCIAQKTGGAAAGSRLVVIGCCTLTVAMAYGGPELTIHARL